MALVSRELCCLPHLGRIGGRFLSTGMGALGRLRRPQCLTRCRLLRGSPTRLGHQSSLSLEPPAASLVPLSRLDLRPTQPRTASVGRVATLEEAPLDAPIDHVRCQLLSGLTSVSVGRLTRRVPGRPYCLQVKRARSCRTQGGGRQWSSLSGDLRQPATSWLSAVRGRAAPGRWPFASYIAIAAPYAA